MRSPKVIDNMGGEMGSKAADGGRSARSPLIAEQPTADAQRTLRYGPITEIGTGCLVRARQTLSFSKFTRAIAQLESLPSTAALRRNQIELQIGLANALIHVKSYAAPETKSAFRQARWLIEQAMSH